MNAKLEADDKEIKWGYAFAGVIAIGIAAVIQFALGTLDDEMAASLPAILGVPYAIAGKLGLTVPLALIGLGLIVRDVAVYGVRNKPTPTPSHTPKRPVQQDEEELEMGEPIAEPAEIASKPGLPKIPGAHGRFGGTRPAGSAPGSNDGQMVLSSAKYLGTCAGTPDFRKGKSVSRSTGD